MHLSFRSLARDLDSVPSDFSDLGFPVEDDETMLILESLAEDEETTLEESSMPPGIRVSQR